MNKSISQRYGSSFRDESADSSEIVVLKEAWFKNGWDVFIEGHIGQKNYTKVFCRISGRNNIIESRLIVFTGGIISLGINSRYSVLLGLTDNLSDVIHENTSLTQDSVAERTIMR